MEYYQQNLVKLPLPTDPRELEKRTSIMASQPTLRARQVTSVTAISIASFILYKQYVNTTNKYKIISSTIPEKSPSDDRDYKIITLSNQLECILVSDPKAEKLIILIYVLII